jgi:hypothetical protein
MEYFGRLVNRDNGNVVAEHRVAIQTLDDAMAAHDVPHVDFIKVDAEGAELDILQGGELTMRSSRLVGLLSEIRLHQEINGSPPFASLDAFVRERGFRLYNIHVTRQSRGALPYPQLHDYRTPSGERFFAYTAHGQVQDGDALYFRDLFNARDAPPLSILKLCALMEIYCLNDCAAELIIANKERLAPFADPEHLLDLLTEGVAEQEINYRDYMAAYFAPPPSQPSESPVEASTAITQPPVSLLRRLARNLFGRK